MFLKILWLLKRKSKLMLILFLGTTLKIMLIGVRVVTTFLGLSLAITPMVTLQMIREFLVMEDF